MAILNWVSPERAKYLKITAVLAMIALCIFFANTKEWWLAVVLPVALLLIAIVLGRFLPSTAWWMRTAAIAAAVTTLLSVGMVHGYAMIHAYTPTEKTTAKDQQPAGKVPPLTVSQSKPNAGEGLHQIIIPEPVAPAARPNGTTTNDQTTDGGSSTTPVVPTPAAAATVASAPAAAPKSCKAMQVAGDLTVCVTDCKQMLRSGIHCHGYVDNGGTLIKTLSFTEGGFVVDDQQNVDIIHLSQNGLGFGGSDCNGNGTLPVPHGVHMNFSLCLADKSAGNARIIQKIVLALDWDNVHDGQFELINNVPIS